MYNYAYENVKPKLDDVLRRGLLACLPGCTRIEQPLFFPEDHLELSLYFGLLVLQTREVLLIGDLVNWGDGA